MLHDVYSLTFTLERHRMMVKARKRDDRRYKMLALTKDRSVKVTSGQITIGLVTNERLTTGQMTIDHIVSEQENFDDFLANDNWTKSC